MSVDKEKVKSIVDTLQLESKKNHTLANVSISGIFLVATFSIYVFLNTGDVTLVSQELKPTREIDIGDTMSGMTLKETLEILAERTESTRNIDAFTSLIAVTATRVGAIFLSIYLIQILLSIFKYYTRLSAFYKGRATALLGVGDEKAEELLATLSPENIDFAKTPSLPYEKVLELAKEAVAKK
ncbi:NAD-dependent DNA ligase [Labrenzia sp. EL_126]|nr:NAD-dependent DNA ligase [Labrenzia sp. EL_126]